MECFETPSAALKADMEIFVLEISVAKDFVRHNLQNMMANIGFWKTGVYTIEGVRRSFLVLFSVPRKCGFQRFPWSNHICITTKFFEEPDFTDNAKIILQQRRSAALPMNQPYSRAECGAGTHLRNSPPFFFLKTGKTTCLKQLPLWRQIPTQVLS